MKRNTAETVSIQTAGQRGPVEHDRRAQIVAAADAHVRHYGYSKTTVADLAKAIGLSTAYIYKFFESKQAIGEAICARCLGTISGELRRIAYEPKPAADRLRRMYKSVGKQAVKLFFNERKLHDIVNISREEHWQAGKNYQATVFELILHVVSEGRESGEFEAVSPIVKTCNAIAQTFLLVSHPVLLEEHLDEIDERTNEISTLVLRGLVAK
jgi:AcrR family transcriptional regulator